MQDLESIERILGIQFRDKSLLLSALTHRSYLNENHRHPVPHNERLEFVGDSVLEMVTTEHLYRTYDFQEGTLTHIRSAVVNSKYLASVTKRLGVEPFILMSKGVAKDTGRARFVILANFIEALIGAMYLDAGYQVCYEFISKHILVALPKIIEEETWIDPKSRLQKFVQARLNQTPTYSVLRETGPDHCKHFLVAAYVDQTELGRGIGASKQDAEINAAKDALQKGVYNQIPI